MCQFKSGITTKNEEVLISKTDFHSKLEKTYNLHDNTWNPVRMLYFKWEFVPNDNESLIDYLFGRFNFDDWELQIDEERTPDWVTERILDKTRRKVIKFLKESRKEGVFPGDLNLNRTKIKKFPKDLKEVEGFLSLYGTQIKELPKGLVVKGDLDLDKTQIKKLPKNLKVKDGLYLNGTKITEGLEVKEFLDLNSTSIKELPKDLVVKRKIYKDF